MTPNFNRTEFACKGSNCCGHSAPIHLPLVELLQDFRDYLVERRVTDPRMTVNSGFRCLRHNTAIGGAPLSQHPLGLAADVSFQIPFDEVVHHFLHWLDGVNYVGGLGIYPDQRFIHFDIRDDGPARWGKTNDGYTTFDEAVAKVLT